MHCFIRGFPCAGTWAFHPARTYCLSDFWLLEVWRGCSGGRLFCVSQFFGIEHDAFRRGHPISPAFWFPEVFTLEHGSVGRDCTSMGGYHEGLVLAAVSMPRDDSVAYITSSLSDFMGWRVLLLSASRYRGISPICHETFTEAGGLTIKGVLLRSEAEPANTPLVEQAR